MSYVRPELSTQSDGYALVDHIAATLQARVLRGEIPSGARLRQETLAAEFEVSRTPVREALRKLQADGIVELEPHRSAVVRMPTARGGGSLPTLDRRAARASAWRRRWSA
jgi:DNA-binding GntR family transcriptional regulator